MNASILTIGDEILNGTTLDTNSSYLAQTLLNQGVEIVNIISCSDKKKAIVDGLTIASEEAQLILITGGLGPTKDDITKYAIADYFEDSLEFQKDVFEKIKTRFEKRGFTITKAHEKQFHLPSKATLYDNDFGSAPGMLLKKEGKDYFFMPGVPFEMKHLLKDKFIPTYSFATNKKIHFRTLMTIGCGETVLAENMQTIIDSLPPEYKVAYLPGLGQVKVRLTYNGNADLFDLDEFDIYFNQLKDSIDEFVYSVNDQKIEEYIGELLKEKKLKLCIAESCTGGFLSQKIVSISGSSSYFRGSVVAYDNELKENLLDVNRATIEKYGAVSKYVVKEMLDGALKRLGGNIGVAITGIAGPTGGTKEKPVGTIWLAYGNGQKIMTKKLNLSKNRMKNIEYTAIFSLNMIRKFILKYYQ